MKSKSFNNAAQLTPASTIKRLSSTDVSSVKSKIFDTTKSFAPLVLRFFIALVLFPHGAQKLLGWFNGFGFQASMDYFTNARQLPSVIGFLVIMIEFFGPLALIAGIAVRVWSLIIAIVMTGIILTTFTEYFFMNWFNNQKTEGMEFFLLMIGMALALVYSGGGRWSVDRQIMMSRLRSAKK